jgi:CMP-N-acetylneuraminic acid synthetase/mannose-6-phosphate isomerase-like protein (cupin superfamily)
MKSVAMIPVRLGSTRCPNKNLRMIDGKPLVAFILETVIASGVFELGDIYINSEADVFKAIADSYGVQFYKRNPALSSNEASNDDWALDFVENVQADILFQFLATSPFITTDDITKFVSKMINSKLDTLISVKAEKIECIFNNTPINFEQKEQTPPSQLLTPVHAYACGLMAWKSSKLIENMKNFGAAYHGGDGQTGFYELGGYSTVDVDTEDDFRLAEAVYAALTQPQQEPTYYQTDRDPFVSYEVHVPEILDKDGVESRNFEAENQTIVNAVEIITNAEPGSWIRRIVNTESNSCCLIAQQPGQGNRRHFHPNWNEWWYIVDGDWDFEISNQHYRIKKNDIVFIPKNTWHKITAVGNKTAVRLAVSRGDVKHGYDTRQ